MKCSQFIDENEVDFEQVKDMMMLHFANAQTNYLIQFPEFPENELGWIQDPSSFNTNKMGVELTLQEKKLLNDLLSDNTQAYQLQKLIMINILDFCEEKNSLNCEEK
jgi:hypothetical protein